MQNIKYIKYRLIGTPDEEQKKMLPGVLKKMNNDRYPIIVHYAPKFEEPEVWEGVADMPECVSGLTLENNLKCRIELIPDSGYVRQVDPSKKRPTYNDPIGPIMPSRDWLHR